MISLLTELAPTVSTENLGKVAAAFVANGALTPRELGQLVRAGTAGAVTENLATDVPVKTDIVPDNPVALTSLMDTVYGAFAGNFRRRSVTALSRLTGLGSDAVLSLIDGNPDFRVSVGQNTGSTFVSLTNL